MAIRTLAGITILIAELRYRIRTSVLRPAATETCTSTSTCTVTGMCTALRRLRAPGDHSGAAARGANGGFVHQILRRRLEFYG